jgi:large subunit ribosomal protein L17
MRRNMAQSLIEHETISTTVQKAKELKPFVEKLITLAKKGKLEHRRRAISLLGNRNIVAFEDGEPVKKGTVVGKLFSELGPRYLDRPGGYARIVRLALRRLGDNGELVLLQLLGADEPVKKERKGASKRRTRRKAKAAQTPAAAEAAPAVATETAEPEAEAGGEAPAAEEQQEK